MSCICWQDVSLYCCAGSRRESFAIDSWSRGGSERSWELLLMSTIPTPHRSWICSKAKPGKPGLLLVNWLGDYISAVRMNFMIGNLAIHISNMIVIDEKPRFRHMLIVHQRTLQAKPSKSGFSQ